MKLPKFLIPVIVLIGVIIFQSVFVVKEIDQAIVLQFGNPKKIITEAGLKLKLTDPNMNRLIFTKEEAANLINRTIDFTKENGGGFVKSYKMKCVNMLDLAKVVSNDKPIEIVGKRPGEKTDEDLISKREIKKTYIHGDDIHIKMEDNKEDNRLYEAYNSATAEKMTHNEMMELVWHDGV